MNASCAHRSCGIVVVFFLASLSACELPDDNPYARACTSDDECAHVDYQCDARQRLCVLRTTNGVADAGRADDGGQFPVLDGGSADAGKPRLDAGPTGVADGGTPNDGGLGADAGPGPGDGGIMLDAGPRADAGIIDGGPELLVFSDNDQATFSAGDGTDFVWFNGALQLGPGVSNAIFTSRVFVAGAGARADRLRWTTTSPLGKPLPDDVRDASELQAYSGGSDLSGLILLLHFDEVENSSLLGGSFSADSSGRAHAARLVDNEPAGNSFGAPATFGSGAFLAAEDYYVIDDADSDPDFVFSSGTFAWSLWMKANGCGPNENNMIALGGELPHIWIGASCPGGTATWQVRDDVGGGGSIVTTVDVADNAWHHLIGIKESSPERTAIYVDGVLAGTRDDDWNEFSNFTKNLMIGNFPIGSPPLWTYQSELVIDEVALFDRALTAEEAVRLYARGATRLRLQLRACFDAQSCGGNAFVGPDGTDGTSFQDLAPFGPPTGLSLPASLVGGAFQYQLDLGRDALSLVPAIREVAFEVTIP